MFWFFTGCITGELLGLRWRDITEKYVIFNQNRIKTNQGEIVKKGLKRQESRSFPINVQLQKILNDLERSKDSDYIFRDRKGKPLILNSLIKAWTRVLGGLELSYRRPYQCRHTFISLCLNSRKLSPAEVAKLVGTSPAMIYKHYLGTSGNTEVPIL
ncbi:tyrosine-type recombinase/integrase [Okeania sp. SIO3I5]|uniref:tyrosine-type recombinase/integrase n=1 Tax=Okeania sp. SIO3I5 TaxID=2607805 RepID=UPI0025D384AB|nr:tyrosine-type recombinase/integrase [Okeania sp. SIO3I5]